ncbi:hypothetical protein FIBSPDRAFT_508728 [Athelia psychrophila]|uniref:Uncharacterized protein n=1 Tax=Athelia psychrophila TaxID=1759441 RepID=A0A166JWR1_9AGAM|nr:hypothetical protein FIBSPDRAFT_508728 [Fibularhizoctonia sp. CBS 109695]
MDLDEHSEYYALFVGAAEWTHGPTEQDDNYELYVEVKVDDSREVHRTMSTVTAQWNQVIRMCVLQLHLAASVCPILDNLSALAIHLQSSVSKSRAAFTIVPRALA